MKTTQKLVLLGILGTTASTALQAQTLTDALAGGTVNGSLYLRYEGVWEDNALEDAKALTLRSAVKYTTATWQGFSALVEFEDVRAVGIDDYSVGPTAFNPGRYSVIADPESSEVNQAYLQYAQGPFTARLGRQDLRYDNMRFVGAVPWRQDFQTFDALTLEYKRKDMVLAYNYMEQRERVFAQAADVDSKDHLLHGEFAMGSAGKLVAYAYLLEEDIALDNRLDTVGLRWTGSASLAEKKVSWLAEFATQDYRRGTVDAEARYLALEGGVGLGPVNLKLGLESLGSDDAAYGFATPLATLHAFQGWGDVWLTTPAEGIDDYYLNLSTPLAGGTFTFVWHDYEANEATPAVQDLGDEFNLQWLRPFKGRYNFGIKYADYSQGDIAAKVDKRVFWSWVQLSF